MLTPLRISPEGSLYCVSRHPLSRTPPPLCKPATRHRSQATAAQAITTSTSISGKKIVANTVLQRIARGDKSAVQECLARYGGLVWSLARRFLGNPTEAEDAVQDIFVELWKNADRYNPMLSSEPTYITMVARRRLIDRRRKIVRRPELVHLPEGVASKQTPGTQRVDLVDEASKAAAALQELRPEQQRVLRMSVYQGLTHEEISQNTGLPLGTVKTHARRGLIKLREVLGISSPPLGTPKPEMAGGL
ncbi:MAG TPA: sigma-70 family RNA polymerase sigma factor [Gemmatales bacterium]|nr:sigma-70 family RNA polymerase sigma factor [Gemmatales bacterium]